jgi:FkbM family methyltransferase
MVLSLFKTKFTLFFEFLEVLKLESVLRLALWDGTHDIHVQARRANACILIRGNSSDADVFRQIFIDKEYSCLLDMQHVSLMIDAGANVGYSSLYFLDNFPNCKIIAIEPDPTNFAALEQNLAPYSDRVTLYNCGVWSQSGQLVIDNSTYRDGREWTRQVRECAPDEQGDFKAITIAEILRQTLPQCFSFLKMDIEGAEAVIFGDKSCQDWLADIDAIAIELHDDTSFGNATNLFYTAIEAQNFLISHSGELTICRRPNKS